MSVRQDPSKYIGILSDTHGQLRPAVLRAFRNVGMILHAGDVGDPAILRELEQLAPVYAVRGNMDQGVLFERLPSTRLLDHNDISIYLLHDLHRLDINPVSSGVQMIAHGHTHRANVEQRQGVWYINPGVAGPTRGRGRPTVVVVELESELIVPTIVPLSSIV
jgi:putative phosphoesterase